jgi:PhzF family phenazine biosynthesis protein
MKIPYLQIDAFTTPRPFSGNPAGVCFLDAWLPDSLMQGIAAQNNLAETAFLVGAEATYQLRWFTPALEVDLCGHATLASAHAIFECRAPATARLSFETRSGLLTVNHQGELLELNFPARPPRPCAPPANLAQVLGQTPLAVLTSRDLLVVLETEEQVAGLKPDLGAIAAWDTFAVIVTAPGRHADFVSRFFAPRAGVPEDPVTGSAHCTLIPYWAARLGKKGLRALQLSARGGELLCGLAGDRVTIAGKATTYLTGTIHCAG